MKHTDRPVYIRPVRMGCSLNNKSADTPYTLIGNVKPSRVPHSKNQEVSWEDRCLKCSQKYSKCDQSLKVLCKARTDQNNSPYELNSRHGLRNGKPLECIPTWQTRNQVSELKNVNSAKVPSPCDDLDISSNLRRKQIPPKSIGYRSILWQLSYHTKQRLKS